MSPRLRPVLLKWLSLVTWRGGKCVGVRSSVVGNPGERFNRDFVRGRRRWRGVSGRSIDKTGDKSLEKNEGASVQVTACNVPSVIN
jgi:hypothetical protein